MPVDPGQFNRGHGATEKTFSDDSQMQTRKVAVQTITTSDTLVTTDRVVLCDATSGAIVVTLPAVSGISGTAYYIKKIDSSANAVTIDGNGAETIDGAATQVLRDQYATLAIVSDASEWRIL